MVALLLEDVRNPSQGLEAPSWGRILASSMLSLWAAVHHSHSRRGCGPGQHLPVSARKPSGGLPYAGNAGQGFPTALAVGASAAGPGSVRPLPAPGLSSTGTACAGPRPLGWQGRRACGSGLGGTVCSRKSRASVALAAVQSRWLLLGAGGGKATSSWRMAGRLSGKSWHSPAALASSRQSSTAGQPPAPHTGSASLTLQLKQDLVEGMGRGSDQHLGAHPGFLQVRGGLPLSGAECQLGLPRRTVAPALR